MRDSGFSERNIDTKQLEAYQFEVRAAQNATLSSAEPLELPEVPKFLNLETKLVIMAFRNMARTFHKSGGTIPNVMEYRSLLLTMACNGLRFDRRPRKGIEK
jgi:hypothetical protein